MLLISYGGTLVEPAEARGVGATWGRYGKSTFDPTTPSVISSGPLTFDPDPNTFAGTAVLDYRKNSRLTFVPVETEDEEELLLVLCVAMLLGVG